LIYSTFAGGSASDLPRAIAIDPNGSVYVTGITQSGDYPVSNGAFQTAFNADPETNGEGFATALDPDGGLIYSTFLNEAAGEAIAADANGNAYVTGEITGSRNNNVYVAELNAAGTALIAQTSVALAGTSARGIGLDGSDNVYVLGFPDTGTNPPQNGFVAKLDATLSSTVFDNSVLANYCFATCSQFLLGGIATQPSGDFYVVGATDFSEAGAFGPENMSVLAVEIYDSNGNKLNSSLIQFSNPQGFAVAPAGIALAPNGNIFVIGELSQSVSAQYNGGQFTAPFGSDLLTYNSTAQSVVSVTNVDAAVGILGGVAVDSNGNPYVTGGTTNNDFPATSGAYQNKLKGAAGNAFVARFVPTTTPTPTNTATPTLTFTSTRTATATATATASPSPTIPRTPLPTRVPSVTTTPSTTPTTAPTAAPTIMGAPTPTQTIIATLTATATTTATPTPTAIPSPIGALKIAPPSINFGRPQVSQTSAVRFVTVANPARNKVAAMITGIDLPSGSGFAIDTARSTCTAGMSLARGKSCRVAITFTPPGGGAFSDNLAVTGNFNNSGQLVGLLGTGR